MRTGNGEADVGWLFVAFKRGSYFLSACCVAEDMEPFSK